MNLESKILAAIKTVLPVDADGETVTCFTTGGTPIWTSLDDKAIEIWAAIKTVLGEPAPHAPQYVSLQWNQGSEHSELCVLEGRPVSEADAHAYAKHIAKRIADPADEIIGGRVEQHTRISFNADRTILWEGGVREPTLQEIEDDANGILWNPAAPPKH